MARLLKVPGLTCLHIDTDFMSHLTWSKGHRDILYVNEKYRNFLRKLVGIKPVRPYCVQDHDWFRGWSDPEVRFKVNGIWHELNYHSNSDTEKMFEYFKSCKDTPNENLLVPKIPLKRYHSWGSN